MGRTRMGFAAAALMCLLGAGLARASDVQGSVVCTDGAPGIPGVGVIFSYGGWYTAETTTDASGGFYLHVNYPYQTYSVSLDLDPASSADALVPVGDVYIGFVGVGVPVVLDPFGVDAPMCVEPPPVTADCSPGYYKNHPETWCDGCFGGEGCDFLLGQLAAGGPGSAAVREAAKALIDACFVTAEASPCTDD